MAMAQDVSVLPALGPLMYLLYLASFAYSHRHPCCACRLVQHAAVGLDPFTSDGTHTDSDSGSHPSVRPRPARAHRRHQDDCHE
ncbi:hypothetical protein EJB05_23850 [Eragrostis curvula]|uniref:Uncharacterized protein n=1 Tax=Eragrostis curvula TaxID=38414 RepID=A0A5J9V9H1_9POAL|nr:hypothetical protein EJB05_23850 [Eragrostis curvula]